MVIRGKKSNPRELGEILARNLAALIPSEDRESVLTNILDGMHSFILDGELNFTPNPALTRDGDD